MSNFAQCESIRSCPYAYNVHMSQVRISKIRFLLFFSRIEYYRYLVTVLVSVSLQVYILLYN